MDPIQPCLWFDDQAEEAARYYVSIFPRSKVMSVARYGPAAAKASGRPEGSVMVVTFRLAGREFLALNGGPAFKFTQAISLGVPCKDQKEIDTYWERLSRGGEKSVCGWLKDKYGLSWQVFPKALMKMHGHPDPAKRERAMRAMLTMKKLDLAALKKAFAGR